MKILRNAIDGVKLGLMFAAAFSVIAIAIFVLSWGAAFDRNFSMLARVIAVYVVGGLVSGVIFGLLRRLARWALGAAVLGVIVALPAYAGMRFAVTGFTPWTMQDTSDVLVLSSLIGCVGGVMLRHRLMKRRQEN